jgi:hypothetical protein
MTIVANVLSLMLACVVGVGPVALAAVLLNRRDRRARALFHEVATQLSSEALRSDVALDVRCGLVSRAATVRLDLGRASSPSIWEIATRLRRGLPARVRLEVSGQVDGPLAVPRPLRITVESPEPAALRPAA